jgi:hypothetical protein
VAKTLNVFRNGAVGFIDWLGRLQLNQIRSITVANRFAAPVGQYFWLLR